MAATPIVVLGMHRSGTSALAKVLGLLGVWLGSEAHVTRRSEHDLVQQCNQSILNELGGHWSAPPALEEGWTVREELAPLAPVATRALEDLSTGDPFGWKDPRTCLTLAYWRERLGAPPIAVVSYRHPLEVVASLEQRNAFGPAHGLALWERYNQGLLQSAAGLRTIVVPFAELARAPVATLTMVREALAAFGVTLRGSTEEAASGIEPERRHHVFDDLPDATVTPQQRDLWEQLRSLQPVYDSFTAPAIAPPHVASSELLAQRAAAIRLERLNMELSRQLRSRRVLARRLLRGATPELD